MGPVGLLCPACGSVMYLARQLKGYPKTGPEADRRTCALHGPLGRFHHLATDRREDPFERPTEDELVQEAEEADEHGHWP